MAAREAAVFKVRVREAAAAQGIPLSDPQIHLLAVHWNLLETWGRKMNLTAIRDLEEVVRRHFLEGLLAGEFLRRLGIAGTLLDLGSGNGFPAVPLRVAHPGASPLVLVESSRKRAAFLRALLRELGWGDSRVEIRRVQKGSDLEDLHCDLFTTRGVTPFDLLRDGLSFLHPGAVALLFLRRSLLDKEISELPPSLVVEAEEPLPGREAGLVLLRKR